MAVYTQISDTELNDFISSFDMPPITQWDGIADGIENTNFLIQNVSNKYILTLFEQRTRAEDLPFFVQLMQHLHQLNINCPQPIANKESTFLSKLCKKNALITSFLNGKSIIKEITAQHCAQLGQALAGLHIAGQSFEPQRENTMSLNKWSELVQSCTEDKNTETLKVLSVIQPEIVYLQDKWEQNLPTGIIHADLFPDNVFFEGDKLSGIIDFYFACTDYLAYDLAICINAWCFDDKTWEFNANHAQKMVKAYQAIRPLTYGEKKHFQILLRGSAVRFLSSRLYDKIHTPKDAIVTVKNPDEYLAKLQFHQNNYSPDLYGI